MSRKLGDAFYLQEDPVIASRELLGKVLCTQIDGIYTSGIISETEAYAGVNDKGAHAYGGKRTERTRVLYEAGGKAYIYLCYGIHHLFNIVLSEAEVPHCILIRGVRPLQGEAAMLKRRKRPKVDKKLSAGPGTLSQALGLHTRLSGTDLKGDVIWIEDRGITVPDSEISVGPRIGIDYAGEDALLPYRFLWS